MIDLQNCPNCGVDAIVVEPDTKPSEIVGCNNCQFEILLKDLLKKNK